MSDQERRAARPPNPAGFASNSKPSSSPGISRAEFDDLKTQIKALEELLSENNQWNAVLRKWKEEGKTIHVQLLSNTEIDGTIKWVDRYTIGLNHRKMGTSFFEIVIIHKGAIATIR